MTRRLRQGLLFTVSEGSKRCSRDDYAGTFRAEIACLRWSDLISPAQRSRCAARLDSNGQLNIGSLRTGSALGMEDLEWFYRVTR